MPRDKILVADDEQSMREFLDIMLKKEGYKVSLAPNGEEVVKLVEKDLFDLILMDINMPDMDGYTLTAKIKKMDKYKNIPIVAVTANVMRGDREKSLEAGCDGYIQKPIDIDTLAQQIERFITRRPNG